MTRARWASTSPSGTHAGKDRGGRGGGGGGVERSGSPGRGVDEGSLVFNFSMWDPRREERMNGW